MEAVVPPYQFLYRSKESTVSRQFTGENEKTLKLEQIQSHKFDKEITNFVYSPNGKIVVFVTAGVLYVYNSDDFTLVSTITSEITKNFEDVEFSPLGTFLVTYIQLDKQTQDLHNLCIWDVSEGKKLGGWTLKNKFTWPMLQWTQDESTLGTMLNKGTVTFYKDRDFATVTSRLSKAGVTQFFIAPGKSDPYIGVFVPFKASEPGYLEIYRCAKPDIPLKKLAFFGDSIEVLWNKDGNAMLILISHDMDKNNYYGKKTLQYYNIQTKFANSVTESFVHDAQWHPNGKEFVLIHGEMPHPKTTVYDLKAVRRIDFMVGEARNKLLFDPTGRILMIGGFGSLGGEMDFWDISKNDVVKMGHAKAFSSTYHSWSPDGFYLLACSLSPRMKVDNHFKIYNLYGHLLYEENINDLYQFEWRCLPSTAYPIKTLYAPDAKKIEIQEKGPEKYRHPNFTGNKTPIGGKPVQSSAPVRYDVKGNVQKPQIGGQIKQGQGQPQPKQNQKAKNKKPAQSKPVVIEEIEQPTF